MLQTFERQLKVSPRRMFLRALDVLSDSVDSRVVILVGNNGDGKTVCGKYMLRTLATNFKYALLIRSVKEWELIEITGNSKPNTIVFFDNFLGSNHLSVTSYTEWEPIFDEIFSACTDGNMSAIIAMGKSVFEEYTSHHRRHPLFADRFIFDLTNEYKLNKDEKIYMIKQNLKGFRYAKDVVFCSEREDDNTGELFENGILSIWEDMVEDIANLEYPVGFPKALEIFASSIENIKQGADFFLNPTLDMYHLMNDTRRHSEHGWFALGNLVLSEGSIQLDTYDSRQIGLNTFGQKLLKKQIKKSLKQVLCSMLSDGADSIAYLKRGIEGIRGYFIEIEDEIARFNCTSTYYSAAICFGKYYPRDVVDIMPKDFIQRCIGPARAYSDKHRLHLELDHASYESLTKRLLNEIEHKNVKEAMDHTYWGERAFVTSFLQYVDKEAKMKILLQTLDENTGKTIVCYGMQRSYTKGNDYNNFTEQVLKTGVWKEHMKKKPQLKLAQEKICLQIAADQRNISSFQAIIERMAAIDDNCFETVIKSGSLALLNIVFKYPTYRIDVCRALEKTALYHFKNDPATAVKMAKTLLSKEKNILIKLYMKNALGIAIENNDVELLDMLRALGADLNCKYHDKEILHLACLQERNECVKLLLESDVDTGFRTASGGTALHIVIANGYYNIAYLLLQHSPNLLRISDHNLQQPLHIAAMTKNIPSDVVEKMIDMGADIDARDSKKKTPLHIAISAKNLEVVELLTKNNACLKLRDIDGQSPIILAYNEYVFNDVEAIFLRYGKLDFYDTELLFKALELHEKSLVMCLLQKMDVNLKNMKGNTLLHAAIELKLLPMVSLLVQSDEIDLELESNGVLPVHQAVIQGDIGIFKLIAEKANNRSTHSATGSTILHIAAKLGRLDIVKCIISKTPSLLAVRNAKSETPLVKAVQQGHDKIVEVLAEYTATQTNEEERIPMTSENFKELKTLETLALRKRNIANGRREILEEERYDKIYGCILKIQQNRNISWV